MKNTLVVALTVVTLNTGGSLLAHHSFAAQYDATKAIRLTGTLVRVEWTNPHKIGRASCRERV